MARYALKSDEAARGRRQPLLLSTALLALACAGGFPAYAQPVTGSGNVDTGPIQSPTWDVGGDLIVGGNGAGQLTITTGGTVTSDTGIIGDGPAGDGTVTVSGGAASWTNSGDLYIGYDGTGTLRILAGGQVSNVTGGIGAGGIGDALVSGQDASWVNSGRLSVGQFSAGTLRVEDGATVSSMDGIVGGGGQGDAVLTGSGTTWSNTGQFTVGSFAAGTLRIEAGATIISNQGYIGANDTGTVTVTGAGSQWLMSPFSLTIGNVGTGTLTVADGGRVRAEAGVLLGVAGGSGGTVLLAGTSANRGILETGSVSGGAGAASFTLDGGLLRATADNSNFFRNFGTNNVAIGANGGVIDTNGFDIAIAPSFAGAGALIKDGAGKLTLSGDSGATYTGAGSVLAGTLAVNGILGGTMEVVGGRLQGTGTVGATINRVGGTIAPGNSIGTLTINGDYVGNGGQLEIEAVLGDDLSTTDRLVITGGTTGTTKVRVLNQGGAGALTVEGIRIIDVGGASNGAFVLEGDYLFEGNQAVVAGAYAYRLQQHGIATPNDGDWYLRSAYLPTPSTGAPVGPIYQAGAPLYEAYGPVLQSLNELQTLRQRVGDRTDALGGNPLWARLDGGHRRIAPEFSTSGADYTIDSWRLEAGADGQVFGSDAGTLVAGVTAHHGGASANVASVFGRGTIGTTSSGIGGSLTWYGASGFYADAQTRLSWSGSDLSSLTAGTQLIKGNAGFGYALGLELGQKLALSDSWSLTPQAQLTYGHVSADTFTDPFGAGVALSDGGSLRGRLGLSADYRQSWRDDAGQDVDMALYGIANLHYDFLAGAKAEVSGTVLTSSGQQLWGGIGLGAKYEAGRYALFGEIEAQSGLRRLDNNYNVAGRAGLKVTW